MYRKSLSHNNNNIISNITNKSKQWKYLLIIPIIILISIAFTLLLSEPATGYEQSIYEAYHPVFWISTGILFILPLVYLSMCNIRNLHDSFSKKTIYGLLAIALTNLILLFHIPKSRGYLTGPGTDSLAHVGYCIDIISSGQLLTENHYPLSHVLISITSLLTEVPLTDIVLSTAAVVAVVFVIGLFSLANVLNLSLIERFAVGAFSIFPVLGYWLTGEYFMPSNIGWALIPFFLILIFHVIFKTENVKRYLTVALILSAAFWFVHPETVLFPAIMVVVIVGLALLINIIKKQAYYPVHLVPITGILVFLVVGFLVFFLSTKAGLDQVTHYVELISKILGFNAVSIDTTTIPTTTVTTPSISTSTEIIAPTQTPITTTTPDHSESTDVPVIISTLVALFGEKTPFAVLFTSTADLSRKLLLLTFQYGQLLIMSAICLLSVIWFAVNRKVNQKHKTHTIIFVLFFIFVGIAVILMTVYPQMWSIYRIYKYPTIFGIIILGLIFANVICSPKKITAKQILSIVLTLSIIAMLILSMSTFYKSPGIGGSNFHVTFEDKEVMTLLYEHRNTDYLIEETGNHHQFRYHIFIYGIEKGKEIYNTNIRGLYDESILPPVNFGYDINKYLGNSYDKKTYYLQTPPYGEVKRWFIDSSEYCGWSGEETKPVSWEHLSMDETVNKIINGDSVNLYLIYPR